MADNKITPYICVNDAAAAIDFYQRAFGAKEQMRITGDDGRIGHAEITIADAIVMMSDEHPEMNVVSPTTLGNTPVSLHVLVDDVDRVYEQAVAAGAKAERPPADQVYGERSTVLRDPFGHRWFVGTKIEDVSFDEVRDRFAAEGYTTTGTPD
jgi:PhnB protein